MIRSAEGLRYSWCSPSAGQGDQSCYAEQVPNCNFFHGASSLFRIVLTLQIEYGAGLAAYSIVFLRRVSKEPSYTRNYRWQPWIQQRPNVVTNRGRLIFAVAGNRR